MKRVNPGSWKDTSPVPPARRIGRPDFPRRAGVSATGTAILCFVALFCIFQYWLLTATLEAYHAGDDTLPVGAFFASLGCFILAAGLTLCNEIALIRQQDFLRASRTGTPLDRSTLAGGMSSSPEPGPSVTAAAHDREKGTSPAAGGDAG